MTTNNSKLVEVVNEIGESVEGFKKTHDKRLDAIQERLEIVEAGKDAPRGTAANDDNYYSRDAVEHKGLFTDWVRNRDARSAGRLTEFEQDNREKKDVVIGTNASGGYAVPKVILDRVDALLLEASNLAPLVQNIQVSTSDVKQLISIHGGTSGWVGETGSRSLTGTPTLREVAPTWGELYSYPQTSEWALQDAAFDVEDWLVNDIVEGMSQNLDSAIWNGNGTNKPTGMTNTAPVATADDASPLRAAAAYEYVPLDSPTSPLAIDIDDLIVLQHKLNTRYLQGPGNVGWIMNRTTASYLRRLKDDNGAYHWQPSVQAGTPDTLLGYPVFVVETMDDYTTDNGLPIAFGNLTRAYQLVTRRELAITPDAISNPGYVRFYVRRRYGGIVTNNDCLKFLKIAEA